MKSTGSMAMSSSSQHKPTTSTWTHFVSPADIARLDEVFARYVQDNGAMCWVIPDWLDDLKRTIFPDH